MGEITRGEQNVIDDANEFVRQSANLQSEVPETSGIRPHPLIESTEQTLDTSRFGFGFGPKPLATVEPERGGGGGEPPPCPTITLSCDQIHAFATNCAIGIFNPFFNPDDSNYYETIISNCCTSSVTFSGLTTSDALYLHLANVCTACGEGCTGTVTCTTDVLFDVCDTDGPNCSGSITCGGTTITDCAANGGCDTGTINTTTVSSRYYPSDTDPCVTAVANLPAYDDSFTDPCGASRDYSSADPASCLITRFKPKFTIEEALDSDLVICYNEHFIPDMGDPVNTPKTVTIPSGDTYIIGDEVLEPDSNGEITITDITCC